MDNSDRAHIYLSFMLHGAPQGAMPVPQAPVLTQAQTAGLGTPGRAPSPAPRGRNGANGDTVLPPAPAAPTAPAEPAVVAQSQARQQELAGILKAIEADGMRVRDISDNEMAKSHARYMVGGRCGKPVQGERLFQFSEWQNIQRRERGDDVRLEAVGRARAVALPHAQRPAFTAPSPRPSC
jgi:threonine dehydratase